MALHKKEESVYLKKMFVFTSRGPLIVRTISWAVDFSRQKGIPNGVDETHLRSKQVWNHHLLTIVHICRPEFVYNGVGSQNRRVVSLKEVFRHQIYMSVAKYHKAHLKIKCRFINLTYKKGYPICINLLHFDTICLEVQRANLTCDVIRNSLHLCSASFEYSSLICQCAGHVTRFL